MARRVPWVHRGRRRARHAGAVAGAAFVRLFPDIYAPAGDAPPDLALRSTGAYLFARGRGVLSGYSAAELHDASCGPADAPAEITVPGGGVHACPGLVVRRDRLTRDEVQSVSGVLVTTRLRAAHDLARTRPDLVDAVAAVDALSR